MTVLARLLVVFFPVEKQAKCNLSGENALQKLNKTIVNTIICKLINVIFIIFFYLITVKEASLEIEIVRVSL